MIPCFVFRHFIISMSKGIEEFYPYHFIDGEDPSQDEALAASSEGLKRARDALYLCRREE